MAAGRGCPFLPEVSTREQVTCTVDSGHAMFIYFPVIIGLNCLAIATSRTLKGYIVKDISKLPF